MISIRNPQDDRNQSGILWVSGYCALPLAAVILGALVLSGCSGIQRTPPPQVFPDMKWQPKFKPQQSTDLFPDRRESRPTPEGTVARGHMLEDTPLNTGLDGKLYIGKNPVPVTAEVLENGQRRFNIYCSPCHDRTGLGKGMVAQRAPNWQPANLTEDRLVQAADGDIFNTITYGRRTMPPYYSQIQPEDRWAIIAWVRVLQRAAHGTINDVPEAQRASVQYKGTANPQ